MMKTKVISYSYTGNNDVLAAEFAQAIGADHIRITEPKKRTSGLIVRENLFKIDPKINFPTDEITEDVFVIFFSPFWFGKLASPLRSCFKLLHDKSFTYGFASLCVGFDNPEAYQNLVDELGSLLGRDPEFVIIKRISDLLPSDPAPTQKTLTQFKPNSEHIKMLVISLQDEINHLSI